MWDVILESASLAVAVCLCALVVAAGRREGVFRRREWGLVVVGTFLIVVSAALDLTDEFPWFGRFVVLGDTPGEAFLEKVVGRSIAYALLLAGVWLWMRRRRAEVDAHRRAAADLSRVQVELEARVRERAASSLEADRRLRDSERRLAFVLEATHEGVWDWNLATGQTYTSPGWLRSFGYDPADVTGNPRFRENLMHPDDVAGVREALRAHAKGDVPFYESQVRLRTKAGDWRWSLVRGRVVEWDGRGRPARMVGTVTDVAERRRAEEERARLLEGERTARAEAEAARARATFLAEASRALGSSLDYPTTLAKVAQLAVPALADWCLIDVQKPDGSIHRTAAHADPTKDDLVQEFCRLIPPPDGQDRVSRVLRTGRSVLSADVSEEFLAEASPDPRHAELVRALGIQMYMIVPLTVRGQLLGAISFVAAGPERRYTPDDLAFAEELARHASLAIDNSRLFQEAQEASRLKDEFLATVSHELRTPLAAMLGWVRVLRGGKGDAARRAYALAAIERGGKAQAQLIDDLLDVSRIVTGKLRLDLRPLDPTGPIEAACETVRPTADIKGIRLVSALDRSAGPVAADAGRLQQVVWNLLSNAVKFTPAGGRVEVRLEGDDSHVRIVVGDTGEGIDAGFLPYVFDRFRQADGSTTRRHGGVGLGLAIVRHLVELHAGTVEAASEGRGHGARFTVTLPRLRGAAAAAPTPAERAPAAERQRLDGLRVLVVDDQPDACEVLKAILEERGAEVTAVSSVGDAMRTLVGWAPNVLVSDLAMPDEDGYALIRRVRALDHELGRIPAVAVTACAGAEHRTRTSAAGYQLHLVKPVETNVLVAAIARLTEAGAGRHG